MGQELPPTTVPAMLTAYITHPDCQRPRHGPQPPRVPERLAAIGDQLLARGLLDYMLPVDAPLYHGGTTGAARTRRSMCSSSWQRQQGALCSLTQTPA